MPAAPVSSAAPVLDRLAVAVGGSARQSPSRVGLLAVFSKLSDLRKPCGRRHSGTVRPDDTKSGPRTVPTFGEISSSRNGWPFVSAVMESPPYKVDVANWLGSSVWRIRVSGPAR